MQPANPTATQHVRYATLRRRVRALLRPAVVGQQQTFRTPCPPSSRIHPIIDPNTHSSITLDPFSAGRRQSEERVSPAAMPNKRYLALRRAACVLLLAAAPLALAAKSGISERLIWTWQAGDCEGSPGAILQDQWIAAASGTELCVVPPSYLCTQSSGASVRWYVDIEIDGVLFLGTTDPHTKHCVTTSTSPVIVHSSTYCTTFPTRYSGKITFDPAVD